MTEKNIPFPPDEYMKLVCGDVDKLPQTFEWTGKLVVEMLVEESFLDESPRFLDVGCGCGRIARYLMDKSLKSYTGFDRHGGMIEWCAKEITPYAPCFDFHHFKIKSAYSDVLDREEGDIDAEAFAFPYNDNAFDSALLASVFTHMPMPESAAYLKELYRIMAPSGKIMLSVFYSDKAYVNGGLDFYYEKDAFLAIAKDTGFDYRFREELSRHNWYVLTKN